MDAHAPFDLARGPAVPRRAAAARRATSTCCCSTMHHIVSDGWSLERAPARAGGALRRVRGRRPSPLRRAARPVRRLRRVAARGGSRATRSGAQLGVLARGRSPARPPRSSCRPTTRARRPDATAAPRHAVCACRIAAGGAARQLGRREGATLFMTLLAGFQALLAPLRAGRTTSSSARRCAGRTRPEIGGRDRLLRQHAGRCARGWPAARRSATLLAPRPRDARSAPGPPGPAVREARGGAAARAQPGPQPRLPGLLPNAGRRVRPRDADARPAHAAAGRRRRIHQVRPGAHGRRDRRRAAAGPAVQPRPVRCVHHPPDAGPARHAPRRRRRRPGAPPGRPAPAVGGGTRRIEAWQTGPALPAGIPLFQEQFALQAARDPHAVHSARSPSIRPAGGDEPSPTASWMRTPTASPITCARSAWGRSGRWACAWHARPSWWRPSSAC